MVDPGVAAWDRRTQRTAEVSDDTWNDETRSDLRESITTYVLGQLRLANSDPEELVEEAAEYLLDEVPEDEHGTFLEFLGSEKARLSAEYQSTTEQHDTRAMRSRREFESESRAYNLLRMARLMAA